MTDTSLSSIYYRDQGVCWYCEMVVPRGTHVKKLRATRDHIIPVSQGGPTTLANLRLAHAYCNTARMGLYEQPKQKIVETIAGLLTPIQLRVAREDIQKNREHVEKVRERRARDAMFAKMRRDGLLYSEAQDSHHSDTTRLPIPAP